VAWARGVQGIASRARGLRQLSHNGGDGRGLPLDVRYSGWSQLGHGDRTGKHLFTLVDPAQFEKARIVIAAGGYDQVLQ